MESVLDGSIPVTTKDEPAYQPLHPNARLTGMIGSAIGFSILTLIGCVAEIIATRDARDWPWPFYLPLISLVAGSALIALGIITSAMRFARFGYLLREKDLIIRSGLIWKSQRCIPRARIQHVDIDSGPIDRALGIVEVKLYVAGGVGAVAELPGLSPQNAEQLKEALIVARTDGV